MGKNFCNMYFSYNGNNLVSVSYDRVTPFLLKRCTAMTTLYATNSPLTALYQAT